MVASGLVCGDRVGLGLACLGWACVWGYVRVGPERLG